MGDGPLIPERYMELFDKRQMTHLAFCQMYTKAYNHGAPGHMDFTVISLLVDLLAKSEVRIHDLEGMVNGVQE